MQHIKDVAKFQRFQSRVAQQLATLPAVQAEKLPPDASICPVCQGFGFYTVSADVDDPAFGKPHKCTNPDCPVVRRNAQERAERLSGQLEAQYANYTFETWLEDVPHEKQIGKFVPFVVAQHFAANPLTPFFLSDVLDSTRNPYQRYGRDGVEMLRANLGRNGVEEVQNSYGNWLVLEGAYGTGKTGLAVAIRHELRRRGLATAFIRLPDFLRAYQDTYRMSDPTEQQQAQDRLANTVRDADALIIDEVNVAGGEERASEDKIRLFQDMVINPRWLQAYHKPVVMTTNLTAPQFETHWDSRTATRIFERAHWLRFSGGAIRHRNRPV